MGAVPMALPGHWPAAARCRLAKAAWQSVLGAESALAPPRSRWQSHSTIHCLVLCLHGCVFCGVAPQSAPGQPCQLPARLRQSSLLSACKSLLYAPQHHSGAEMKCASRHYRAIWPLRFICGFARLNPVMSTARGEAAFDRPVLAPSSPPPPAPRECQRTDHAGPWLQYRLPRPRA